MYVCALVGVLIKCFNNTIRHFPSLAEVSTDAPSINRLLIIVHVANQWHCEVTILLEARAMKWTYLETPFDKITGDILRYPTILSPNDRFVIVVYCGHPAVHPQALSHTNVAIN